LYPALKMLDLPEPAILSMSKKQINPKFISSETFRKMGINNEELIEMRLTIGNESNEAFETWKGKLRHEIRAVNPGNNNKFYNIMSFYLSDWENLPITKQTIKEYVA
jgi:hypothetical protein